MSTPKLKSLFRLTEAINPKYPQTTDPKSPWYAGSQDPGANWRKSIEDAIDDLKLSLAKGDFEEVGNIGQRIVKMADAAVELGTDVYQGPEPE